MKHLGDITKINGATAPPVEVIIGGSPCQDLSIAGRRAGLGGERSGLFMEQIRLIKEMRENDRASGRTADDVRPRFMVWENVPGAFSSNKGEDFRIVLEETARVADKAAVIPRPPQGKWTNSGAVVGDGWSLAWRVFDAQFWGVPQRRRRIALIADFAGESAPKILFERESVPGDSEPCGTAGQRTARTAESGAYGAITNRGDVYGISAYESNAMKSSNPNSGVYVAETARTLDNNGGSPACNQGGMAVVQSAAFKYRNGGKARSIDFHDETTPTLGTDGNEAVLIHDARGNGDGTLAPTITGDHQNRVTDYTAIVYSIDRAAYNQGINAKYDIGIDNSGTVQTIVGKGPNAVCIGNGQADQLGVHDKAGALNCMHDRQAVIANAIVRRLTPLECERLQGYPDGWTDIGDWTDSKGKKHKAADSPRYKALGNSIALPNWVYVLSRLNAFCRAHTMASLFDGIGGFPLIWETLNGKDSAVWASEIEEFPIAVSKRWFPDES